MRQHYTDLNKRPFDWQDKVAMTGAASVVAFWLSLIVEGLIK